MELLAPRFYTIVGMGAVGSDVVCLLEVEVRIDGIQLYHIDLR
jgi:hypothetical protein